MKILSSVSAFRAWRAQVPTGHRVGFIPTMGALHAGHLALVKAAREECDTVVASIFVNPTQFDRAEDLSSYPRMPAEDAALLSHTGCHSLLLPTAEDMYPNGPSAVKLHVAGVSEVLEGAARPGHFDGVALVVTKLLNLVQPTYLYMGAKDLQQTRVVGRMLSDLFSPIVLRMCPTLREADGLAMSAAQRAAAPVVYRALQHSLAQWEAGASREEALAAGSGILATEPQARIDYLTLVDHDTLHPPTGGQRPPRVAILAAVYFGPVRLIDNVVSA